MIKSRNSAICGLFFLTTMLCRSFAMESQAAQDYSAILIQSRVKDEIRKLENSNKICRVLSREEQSVISIEYLETYIVSMQNRSRLLEEILFRDFGEKIFDVNLYDELLYDPLADALSCFMRREGYKKTKGNFSLIKNANREKKSQAIKNKLSAFVPALSQYVVDDSRSLFSIELLGYFWECNLIDDRRLKTTLDGITVVPEKEVGSRRSEAQSNIIELAKGVGAWDFIFRLYFDSIDNDVAAAANLSDYHFRVVADYLEACYKLNRLDSVAKHIQCLSSSSASNRFLDFLSKISDPGFKMAVLDRLKASRTITPPPETLREATILLWQQDVKFQINEFPPIKRIEDSSLQTSWRNYLHWFDAAPKWALVSPLGEVLVEGKAISDPLDIINSITKSQHFTPYLQKLLHLYNQNRTNDGVNSELVVALAVNNNSLNFDYCKSTLFGRLLDTCSIWGLSRTHGKNRLIHALINSDSPCLREQISKGSKRLSEQCLDFLSNYPNDQFALYLLCYLDCATSNRLFLTLLKDRLLNDAQLRVVATDNNIISLIGMLKDGENRHHLVTILEELRSLAKDADLNSSSLKRINEMIREFSK